ncbi:hypothetical protein CGRA01v4_13702 [Colletotrichum graminicola]|uniref:Uncharacterized protein n=1 Tax=Colletotrichum graminicola (strain M1.001 / M2 / FGSC 10212) TaxID=645133 RepID=E3QX43_COLGM|nr:uncharacterized protein GLRG_10575 [Colletotrichum graminicola M1.001]EFQ35431.1 hypothetical protein GLRG_10575 [Colletotrichum graminicola M1.001]WDK22411.1 hypothetical protein CGRA01v4_13702 [Colletotrichum graminicola]
MPLFQASKLPFFLHIAIETASACSFIFNPASQLPDPSPATRLVLQSFGGLLLSTNLVCLAFVARPFDETTRRVAAALAFWHAWPCWRAYVRLARPVVDGTGKDKHKGELVKKTLGGPGVHLAVHVGMFVLFAGAALVG